MARSWSALLATFLVFALPADARTIAGKDRRLDFHYAWPTLPAGLPRLEARLQDEAAKARRTAIETWAKQRRDSGEEPPRHCYEKDWKFSALSPRLLALLATNQVYAGGAHEGIAYDALLWDRKADRVLTLAALFADSARALAAMEEAYCSELESEQRERRGDGFREEDFACPAMAKEPVALTGSRGRISGFEVLLDPYAAGSWAEGPYEVELRFSPAVLKLVKPEFRASFGR